VIDFVHIPDAMAQTVFWGLVFISFFTSLMTAAFGIGGGAVLLAVMAQFMPVQTLIPVHGVVHTGSNFGRALVMWRDVRWDLLRWFLAGCLLGAVVGGNLVVSLPKNVLRGVLGIFILYSVWGPSLKLAKSGKHLLAGGGVLSTILTMFVGATGPFVVAFLRAFKLPSLELVATSAVCMVTQHLLKVLVFGLLGFVFAPYIHLIVFMIASGFLGTLVGRTLLLKIDERKFQLVLNSILTLLALRLIFTAFS